MNHQRRTGRARPRSIKTRFWVCARFNDPEIPIVEFTVIATERKTAREKAIERMGLMSGLVALEVD